MTAASMGSVAALEADALLTELDLQSLIRGENTPAEMAGRYALPPDTPSQFVAEILAEEARTSYLTIGMLGDPASSSTMISMFQSKFPDHISVAQIDRSIEHARKLVDSWGEGRALLNLEELPTGYPASYAQALGYPIDNTFYEDPWAYLRLRDIPTKDGS